MQARFQGTNDGIMRDPLAQRRKSDICKHAFYRLEPVLTFTGIVLGNGN